MITYTFFNETYTAFQQDGTSSRRVDMQNGFLFVEVFTADGRPIPRASILIYTENNGKVETAKVERTGIDGRTQRIALAVPAKEFSLLETSIQVPYKTFSIRIEIEGYYTETYRNVQIYTDTTITLKATLSPLPLGVNNSATREAGTGPVLPEGGQETFR
jgi:hypothetical protein